MPRKHHCMFYLLVFYSKSSFGRSIDRAGCNTVQIRVACRLTLGLSNKKKDALCPLVQ